MKLQEELKDSGFVVIASHVQNVPKDDVIQFLRQQKVNFTVTSGGDVPGDTANTIPRAFLFDSKGRLVERGLPSELKAKIPALVASEPHWLAAGRDYTKLKPVAESLKTAKSYGPILKKLDGEMKGSGPAAEEAKYLSERILGHGKSKLEKAKAMEGEDPFPAQQLYTDISLQWKGSEPGTEAAKRLKELKGDKEFQKELKASTVAHQILAQCDKLVAQQGKINLEYAPNREIAASVRSLVPALKKKYAGTKAASTISQLLEPYGFKDL